MLVSTARKQKRNKIYQDQKGEANTALFDMIIYTANPKQLTIYRTDKAQSIAINTQVFSTYQQQLENVYF